MSRLYKLNFILYKLNFILYNFCTIFGNFSHKRQDIIKSQVRPNRSNYNITLNDEYKFIDVNPQNETQLQVLYNAMIQDHDDDLVVQFLEHPQTDQGFERNVEKNKWTDVGKPLVFPRVNQPYSLFYKMWKVSHPTK